VREVETVYCGFIFVVKIAEFPLQTRWKTTFDSHLGREYVMGFTGH